MRQIQNLVAFVIVSVLMSGCASSDEIAETPQSGNQIAALTITLNRDGDGTRAVNSDTGETTFEADDQIALFYTDSNHQTKKLVSRKLTSGSISAGGKKATFTFDEAMTDPETDGAVRIVYPASMANAVANPSLAVDDDALINYESLYRDQDGTWEKVSREFSLAVLDGTLEGTSLPAHGTLYNQLAIVKMSLLDGEMDQTTHIAALNINDGTDTYSISPVRGRVCIAMKPITSADTLYVTAAGRDKMFQKKVFGHTLEKNNIYQVRVSMTALREVLMSSFDRPYYLAKNGDMLTGGFGRYGYIEIEDGAIVMLNKFEGSLPNTYIKCLGDATIVTAESTSNSVHASDDFTPAIYVPEGKRLTICGQGTLDCMGEDGAAIGSGNETEKCGDIIIGGGVVYAHSVTTVAIGAGNNSGCGKITITGGDVWAYGRQYAIGADDGATCGDITIIYNDDYASPVKITIVKGTSGYINGTSVTIDGVTTFDYITSTTQFPHFNSELSDYYGDWILTEK